MKTILFFLAALLLPLGAAAQVNEQPGQASVASPDQNLRFVFYQKANAGGKRELYYLILYPRSKSRYPLNEQEDDYKKWFADVPLGLDVQGGSP